VSFAAINLCVASQRVFIVVVYFVIDSVRKLLDTPSYLVRISARLPAILMIFALLSVSAGECRDSTFK
jgi:hypothetical protein